MDKFLTYLKFHYKRRPVTTIIIIINTLLLIVTIVSGGFSATNLVRLGGLLPSKITNNKEYYRLLMAMFLHGSVLHFFFNTYFTYMIGRYVERLLGSVKYLVIYLLSGLGSSVLVWLFEKPNVVTIGASGALFGIMGSLLLYTFSKKEWFSPPQIKSIRSMVIINLIFTFLMPSISVLGHIGGFVSGLVLAYLFTLGKPRFKKTYKKDVYYKNNKDIIDHDEISDDDILN